MAWINNGQRRGRQGRRGQSRGRESPPPHQHTTAAAQQAPLAKGRVFFNELVDGQNSNKFVKKNSTFRPPAGGEKVEFLFNELVGRFPRENHHFPTSLLKKTRVRLVGCARGQHASFF